MKKLYIVLIAAVIATCGLNKANNVSAQESHNTAVNNEKTKEGEKTEKDKKQHDPYAPHVCTSEDGIMTIEYAMIPGGGTAPDFWSRWKFKNKNGKDCEFFDDDSPAILKVHSIKKDDGSTYYIIKCYGKASSSLGYEWLQAYRIVDDTVEEVSVIDGGKNINNYDFYIDYDIPYWYSATDGAGYDWIFEYDPETQCIYAPIVLGQSVTGQLITDRYRLWHFNGERFIDMGERPHKDMHLRLADYKQLMKLFETKDYIVRVDLLNSNELRYASWKKPKTMSDKPDLVLKRGYKKEYFVAPDQLCPCDDYRFTNGSYEYIVNYCEMKMKDDGYGEHHDFLVVKKDGKTVLKQEKLSH